MGCAKSGAVIRVLGCSQCGTEPLDGIGWVAANWTHLRIGRLGRDHSVSVCFALAAKANCMRSSCLISRGGGGRVVSPGSTCFPT